MSTTPANPIFSQLLTNQFNAMGYLSNWIIKKAKKTPYRKGHLFHADGSTYMERYVLFETKWLSARVHYIATADIDPHLHDHPWSFISVLLRGGYTERRPKTIAPCFTTDVSDVDGIEATDSTHRAVEYNHWAWRHATDRHRIAFVYPDTWSLFIYGPVRQWWGFYTQKGKIHFLDYLTRNSTRRIAEGDR